MPKANMPELCPTRESLIERLRDLDDQTSWRTFFDIYWKLIYTAAVRAGLSDQEAEDAVQETIICIARKMETYCYRPDACSFKGWLMHVTRRRIADQYRRRRGLETPLDDEAPEAAPVQLQEDIWDEEWRKNLLDVALQHVRAKANPEHYQIFHLHAVQGIGPREVAKLMGVSLAKVYVVCHRMARQVKVEAGRLEKTEMYAT